MFREWCKTLKNKVKSGMNATWNAISMISRELYKALKVEIKHAMFETWFHFVRFGGLLIIPLIYGFSYVFAFWDPFTKVDQLPIVLVTQKNDTFGDAVGKVMNKTQTAQIGELKLNIKADHIYADVYSVDQKDPNNPNNLVIDQNKVENFSNQKMDDYHVGFVLPSLTKEVDALITSSITSGLPLMETFNLFSKLSTEQIQIINNFKKNYLIAFGIDLGSSMAGTQKMMVGVIVKALTDPEINYGKHLIDGGQITKNQYDKFTKDLVTLTETLKTNNFEFVRTETYMHEHAKYGFGLTPFFVSVAMWIGAMVMTFAVHRKIYDKTNGPVARYFAKWFMIVGGTMVQATILLASLCIIGLDKLGMDHWGYMYGFAIFTGIVFGTIVQAIRFIIPSRNIGIFVSIVLLVLQMASAGGLFPIETQAAGYKFLNTLLPMGHTVKVYRELSFETRWGFAWEHIAYLCIYPILFLAGGLYINKISTIKLYKEHGWTLPEHMLRKHGGA